MFRLQWMQWIGCNTWKGKFVALLWMHQTAVIVTPSSALQPLLKVSKLKNCLCKSKRFYIVFILNLLRPFQDHCQSKSNMGLGQHVVNPNQLTSNVLIVSHQNHWDNCAESHCKQPLTTWINETLQIVIFIAELSIYFGLFLSWNCWTVAMTPCILHTAMFQILDYVWAMLNLLNLCDKDAGEGIITITIQQWEFLEPLPLQKLMFK